MKPAKPYRFFLLIALVALLCGCVAEDFAAPNDLTLDEDVGLDGSAGDVPESDADAGGADVIACQSNADCADEANANQTGICENSTDTCRFVCHDGYSDCDGDRSNGCETHTKSDANHCGQCGNVCPTNQTNYEPICVDGKCDINSDQCLEGFVDLDSSVAGCECQIADPDNEPTDAGTGSDYNCTGVDG